MINHTFCQDYFVKATLGQSIWCLICSGIRRWKENYFQLRLEPTLPSTSTAQVLLLEEVLIPLCPAPQEEEIHHKLKYAPKTRTGPCRRSEQQQNQEFVGCCIVLHNVIKEKKKTTDLLNISPAPQYFLSPEIYCLK